MHQVVSTIELCVDMWRWGVVWMTVLAIYTCLFPIYPLLRYTVQEWIENNKNPETEGPVGETDGPEKATQTFARKVDQRSSDAIPDSSSPSKKFKTASTTAHC